MSKQVEPGEQAVTDFFAALDSALEGDTNCTRIAKSAGLYSITVYRLANHKVAHPSLPTAARILAAIGYQIRIEPME